MATYVVLEPPNAPADRMESAERLAFIRDGFTPYAAALPPVWLLVKRMWIEFGIYMGLVGIVAWFFTAIGHGIIGNAALLIIQILFGFEAGLLHAASLERRGWRFVGSVDGGNREDCERRFFEMWLPTYTTIPAPTVRNEPSSSGGGNGASRYSSSAASNASNSDALGMPSQRPATLTSDDGHWGDAGGDGGADRTSAAGYSVPSWTHQAITQPLSVFMRGRRALQGT
ncbi:DUF2628 domain-containing protein [Hyphomicrobium sp. D-2]|uniref:DUF2628 domain-containing protein n=1 Tax=Hyphomicrobium sp. D-2 TaxID=3041621 RepID=UPI002455EC00|nr:DUF2628 domain-containing protein [Hyphomicrobium sp. D-2]MDH4983476.1 DUF2628 domain-containing protein [Hyphomicrobium sp. D-2]